MHINILSRRTARATSGAVALALMALTPAHAETRKVERGLEPTHQPVVERTDFVFDLVADSNGGLGASEERRLVSWFNALDLGYGDKVTFAQSEGYAYAGLRDGVTDVVARYGLLTGGEAPLSAGNAPAGGLRVVVSRSIATVKGCPAWRDKSEADLVGGLSDNYGCAMASNMAAMIADPQDLVEGRKTETDLRGATSSRAIKAYQDKAPTGAGGLQAMSVGGQ